MFRRREVVELRHTEGERTSKVWKVMILLGASAFGVYLVMALLHMSPEKGEAIEPGRVALDVVYACLGAGVYGLGRFGAWWAKG